MSQASFLARVREALQSPAPKRHLQGHGIVEEHRADGPESFRAWLPPVGPSWTEQFELFQANATVLKAEVVVYTTREELTERLRALAQHEGWKRMAFHKAAWSEPVVEALAVEKVCTNEPHVIRDLEACSVGITECDALVAQAGTVLVSSQSAGGRALSVLPPHHIVLARHDQLVPDLEAALKLARHKYAGNWPSMLSFISGPSRTGDIERILVLGAHGPKRLTIFCDRPPGL